MTYRRIRNQELSIKIKPTNSSSNILYEPDFIFNDVKQYLEKKYPDELLIDSQEKVGIDFFTKKMLNNENFTFVKYGDGEIIWTQQSTSEDGINERNITGFPYYNFDNPIQKDAKSFTNLGREFFSKDIPNDEKVEHLKKVEEQLIQVLQPLSLY